MSKSIFLIPFAAAVLLVHVPLLAEGPGSRIGTTPQVPLAPQPVASELTQRCERLRDEERERCLREAKSATASATKPSGPETTGMGSGAGAGSSAGTSGGGSFGAAAPR
jgi:hypothetical protein